MGDEKTPEELFRMVVESDEGQKHLRDLGEWIKEFAEAGIRDRIQQGPTSIESAASELNSLQESIWHDALESGENLELVKDLFSLQWEGFFERWGPNKEMNSE